MDKPKKIKVIPFEEPPLTVEEFCGSVVSELKKINKTLKQLKGILSEIKENKNDF